MATSADLNWEESLIAQWMSDASRAGVILNSAFPSLKNTRAIHTDNILDKSANTSLSEDSLYREQALEFCSPCEEKLDTVQTLCPISLAKKEQRLMDEDAPACWDSPETDFKFDQLGDLDEGCYSDPLLHKLQQLKGLQQHKQEQLKKQQMEQIHRLMEQRQKLLSMASDQQGHTDFMGGTSGDIGCEDTENENMSESLDEGKCFESLNAEERPIPAHIQERKQTFEEFLEEQIQLEEQRLSQKGNLKDIGRSTCQKPVTKRPFLKRGEGLSRFTNAKSKVAKQKESKVPLHPNTSEVKNAVKADKPQLHRKTVSKNKEQSSDNFVSKSGNLLVKSKRGFAPPARKTAVLRNCIGKSILPSTRSNPNEKKLGHLRDSERPETNGERDENKENIMELAKLDEADRKLMGEKHQQPGQLILCQPKCHADCFEKDPELSFELSFQKKLENWDTVKQQEQIELDEFLFLEQAADEISFASNSSVIIKILDQGHQISTGHRLSSTPIKSGQQQMNGLDVTAMNNRNGEMCISQQANNEGDRKMDSQSAAILKDHQQNTNSEMHQAFSSAECQDFKNTEWDESESDGSSNVTCESEDEFEITIKPATEEAKKLPLSNGGDGPKLSEGRGLAKLAIGDISLDLLGKKLGSGCSSEIMTNEVAETQSVLCANRKTVEFDDDRSWSDFEKNGGHFTQEPNSDVVSKVPLPTDCSARSEAFLPDKVIKRKIAIVKKGDVMPKQSLTDSEMSPPPTTDLMLKLFPSLRPKQKAEAPQRHDAKPNMSQEEPGDSARSQLLREKIVELELEIERFREENASLTKLREEREIALETLRKEIANFEQQKTKELTRIEEFKKEETRKLQKERKVFEKYTLAARAIPDKRERDEIQVLKQQLATLQEDLKKREAKWSTTHVRLRDQIETLTKENTQLREEIKIMERFRLEAWKRKEAPASKRNVDGCGVYSQRTESTQLPAALQKSQTLYLVPQEEKNSKTNGKSDQPSEGNFFARPRLAPPCDEHDLDNMAMTPEDSKTFLANLPGNGTVEPSTSMASDSAGSEEETEREMSHPDGRVEKILKDGSQLIIYPNGTRKEVSCDGKTTTVTFFNGDIKQVLEDQRVIYYYADAKTTHTTYPNNLEVLHFSNGQIEKHFPDGRKEVAFPDQTIMNAFPDGREETIFPDGTIVRIQQDRSKIIEFNNGQQELHTAHFKRREYPDGSIKTVYANGRQETKYASGRIRVKDKDGSVIMDTLP